jgi:predicted Zn-dependent protease
MPIFPRIILLILCTFLGVSQNALALSIIRDSEIEAAIASVADPLKKAADLEDLKIYIVNDDRLNAFTTGRREIFITRAMLINYPDPDILRGIIAHEMGHIIGHHIIAQSQYIENYKKAAAISMILGVATALSGSVDGALAVTAGGMHMVERSILAYARELETSADLTAIMLLDKSHHSAIGLIKLFSSKPFAAQGDDFNIYESTHPIDSQRLSMIRQYYKQSAYQNSTSPSRLRQKYSLAMAKLFAYTANFNSIFQLSPDMSAPIFAQELTDYIEAIRAFRQGRLSYALKLVDKLLAAEPENPYYHEFKGQIYLEFSEHKALAAYTAADAIKPNDELISIGKNIAGIMANLDSSEKMKPYASALQKIVDKEPGNISARYYLAIYYDRINSLGLSYFNKAIISLAFDRTQEAMKMLKAAVSMLKVNSPEWYKATDLLESMQQEQ